jgi:ADP-ribose pyrophosphatase
MSAQVNHSTTLHEGRVFRLVRENVTLVNGVTVDLDIVRHPGASAVVPIFGKETILLIKQYRHAIGDFIWEIPAGTLDLNEPPLACAKRELIEETGYAAERWQKLGEITPVPGYSDERIHLFMASGLKAAQQDLDKDEVLHVHEVKLREAMEMIFRGDIQDSKTISGLFMVKRRWRGKA